MSRSGRRGCYKVLSARAPGPGGMLRTLAMLALAAPARGKGLTDEPLTAGAHQGLTGAGAGSWTATSAEAGVSVAATVPGDLSTDLER